MRFNTEGCCEEQFNLVLLPTENVDDILVNVKYLNHICMKWKHVKKLVINFTYTAKLRVEEIDFSHLSMLTRLTELTIKGSEDFFQKLVLYKSFLHDIIPNLKQTKNAMLCNNRDDLLHLSFTLKISIFSEVYIQFSRT